MLLITLIEPFGNNLCRQFARYKTQNRFCTFPNVPKSFVLFVLSSCFVFPSFLTNYNYLFSDIPPFIPCQLLFIFAFVFRLIFGEIFRLIFRLIYIHELPAQKIFFIFWFSLFIMPLVSFRVNLYHPKDVYNSSLFLYSL